MKYFLFILGLLTLPVLVFAAEQATGFVPLTNVPFIQEAGNSIDLTQFLNGLYRLCIGVAAVLAVVQIMRAGIVYMGGDSFTEKKEAKNLIAMAIGGLVLVLSPVVVFSVINPEILSLKIGGIESLKVETPSTSTTTATTTANLSKTCTDYKQIQAMMNACDTSKEFVQIDKSCCGSISNGALCCGSTKAPAPTWGWRGKFYPETTPSQVATRQQGPFTTQQACFDSLGTWPSENKQVATGDFVCDCNKPLSEQSGCNNF